MDKTITFGLSEWYYLICLVQGRRQELRSKQYIWDKNLDLVEKIELKDYEKNELRKCEELYESLHKQVGLR